MVCKLPRNIIVAQGEYTPLNYIQSSGTQYINTGITGKSGIKVILDVEPTTVSGTQSFFGSQYNNGQRYSVNILNGKYEMQFWSDYGESSTSVTAARHTIEADFTYNAGSLKVDGTTVQTRTGSTSTSTYTWYLFARHNGNSVDRQATMKLYSAKFYDGNTLVRDYAPCLDDNGVVCLYDKVNKEFCYNAGSGVFVGG